MIYYFLNWTETVIKIVQVLKVVLDQFQFFSAKIAEHNAGKFTGNKYNVNFVFKPGVTSHN